MFGIHLTLDCYGCNREKLNNLNFILKFLNELPDLIGMKKIAPPHAISYPGNPNSFDKGGISAFVIIAESHISCHTFPFDNYVSVDIFSCKNFDIDKAINFVIKKFEVKKYEKKIFTRGKEFPKEVLKVVQIIEKERQRMEL